ncbi:MAG: hypothetical protein J0H11_15210 [Rhizobiales bacterium]|nr:hypothetical protein [Hyphomicrobiales bacterium]
MLRIAFYVVVVGFNTALGIVVIYLMFNERFTMAPVQAIEYKDFIAILLTALGVMIALGAFIVALLAVWGYREGKQMVIDAAVNAAIERVDEVLPGLFAAQMDVLRSSVDPSLADQIAAVADDGTE